MGEVRLVKRITVTLDEDEFERWKSLKGKKSWYEFFKELINNLEESENVSSDTVRHHLTKLCADLADLAASCSYPCNREEVLLRVCSGREADKRLLLQAFVIISNALENLLDEYSSWLVRLLKAIIVEVVRGDVRGVKELLDELCSSR